MCVTPLETIDRAHAIAAQPGVIFTSFGDMLRVPGTRTDLLRLRAAGADVRVVYSPLDALQVAQENPNNRVVFFGVGFETTAPANAMALLQAKRIGVENFSLLASHVLVPPAISAILESPGNRVQAFLGPGHVCAVVGYRAYEELATKYRVPIVITGFEPVDLIEGIWKAIALLKDGLPAVDNQYDRAVRRDGNEAARAVVERVFEVADKDWRGLGRIARSGHRIREEYRPWDAEAVFNAPAQRSVEPDVCISGLVLSGLKKPPECPAFGKRCTPEAPLGATMVSPEGACAAYHQYGRSSATVAAR